MVREGLTRLDGVRSVSEQANNKFGTCDLWTDGNFLPPRLVADNISAQRVGARLRGIEAVVYGVVVPAGRRLVLNLPGQPDVAVLHRLDQKVQLHDGQDLAPASEEERSAHDRLRAICNGQPLAAKIVGPLRYGRDGYEIRVRDFEITGTPNACHIHRVELGIDVNGPYGIGEPWSLIRDALGRVDGVKAVHPSPNLTTSSAAITPEPDDFPDLRSIDAALRNSGAGARLREAHIEAEGQLISAPPKWILIGNRHQLELTAHKSPPRSRTKQMDFNSAVGRNVRVTGFVRQVRPGTLNIQVQTLSVTDTAGLPTSFVASNAASRPKAPTGFLAKALRNDLIGFEWPNPREAPAGYHLYRLMQNGERDRMNKSLLTDRAFLLPCTNAGLLEYYVLCAVDSSGVESDSSEPVSPAPPAAPVNLQVRWTSKGRQLTWNSSPEADFSSYNIFRSVKPNGPYTQIAAGITQNSYVDTSFPSETAYYYVVTATDSSSNQSAYSNEGASTKPAFAFRFWRSK